MNIGGAATTVSIASSSGTTTINNNLRVGKNINIADIDAGVGTTLVIDSSGQIFKSSSSRRYKNDIASFQVDFSKILETQPISFKYNDTRTTDIGYLAEDFDKLGLKELVLYDKNGLPDAIKYDKLSLYIIEVLKKQQKSIQELQNTKYKILDTIETINVGLLEAKDITANSLTITGENVIIGGQTLRDYISLIVNDIVDKRLAERDRDKIVIVSPIADAQIQITPTPTPTIDNSQLTIDNSASNSANASASADPSAPTPSPEASPSVTPTPALDQNASPSAEPNASPSATPTPESGITNLESGMNNESGISEASSSAIQNSKFKIQNSTFPDGFISLGPTSLVETSINGQLLIGSNMTITENSINSLGTDLFLQPLRQANLSIMGGLVTVNTDGDLQVAGSATFAKDVKVNGKLAAGIIAPIPDEDLVFRLGESNQESGSTNQGKNHNSSFIIHDSSGKEIVKIDQSGSIIASGSALFSNFKLVRGAQADTSFTETVASGSAGTATITANELERTIITPFVTEDSLIYITPVGDTHSITPYIARQTVEDKQTGTRGSFTIQVQTPLTKDLRFNWIIIN